jgi:hypothetical protein
VYCGLASADVNAAPPGSETWLTVAVVDDSGRLLDICDISNDATGFAELGSLLAERSNGLESVAVAADSDDHIVTQLLTAAGRYLAYTDEDSAEDYAERFSDAESADEMQSSPTERRAIGLARALQAGVLSAVAQATPRDLLGLKPVLAAHAAVTTGRQGTAATLREVLRELYPAALRAFPDPAEPIPLAVLDALPEPGPLGNNATGRGRDAQAVVELAEAGVADSATLTEAVTALRVAIAETPRRTGMNRSITTAVAETVRQSVAAVRACDDAAAALVSVLSSRMPTSGARVPAPQATRSRSHAAGAPAAEPVEAVHALPPVDEPARPAGRRSRSSAARPRSAPPVAVQPQSAPPAMTPATPQSAPPAMTPDAPPIAPAAPPIAPAAPPIAPAAAPIAPAAPPIAPAAPPIAPAAAQQVVPTPPPAPTAPQPMAPAASSGVHRADVVDPPTLVQAAPRTRAARRAAEKQQQEQAAGTTHPPTPMQIPAPAPTPVHTQAPPPVPLQAPPAPIPVPPPATIPTPVHPPAQGQPQPAVVRPQRVPSVPPPGTTPAYSTGPRQPTDPAPFADPRAARGPQPATSSFTLAPGPVPSVPMAAESPVPRPTGPSQVSGPPAQSLRGTGPGDLNGYTRGLAEHGGEAGSRPGADLPPPGSRVNWPLASEGTHESGEAARMADPRSYRPAVEPGTEILRSPESRPMDLPRPGEAPQHAAEMPRVDFSRALDGPGATETPGTDPAQQRDGRIVPPWQSNDLPAEPPALRLVEPAPLIDPALAGEPPQYRDQFTGELRLEPPALRLVDANGAANGGGLTGNLNAANGNLNGATNGNLNAATHSAANGGERPGRRSAPRRPSAEPAEPPAKSPIDGDLLIFAEARSAWFTDHFGEDDNLEFANASDEGWRAAEHAAEPLIGAETQSGLPRRVPQQNLVPGSPTTAPERPLRVVRDPAAIAAHTSGYFRGWQRGQEVGGYRVGGRPGRESSAGWDFSRDQGDDERDYEYRSARR